MAGIMQTHTPGQLHLYSPNFFGKKNSDDRCECRSAGWTPDCFDDGHTLADADVAENLGT